MRTDHATMLRTAIAVAVGLLLAVGTLVAVMSKHQERLAGTNSEVEFSGVALPVRPGADRCAPNEMVPSGASSVRVYAGTFGRPGQPVSVTVLDGARQVSQGRLPGGYPDNTPLRIPITPIHRNLYHASVCLRNLGTKRLQFAGNLTPQVGPKPAGAEQIRYDWLLPGRPTGWSEAPRAARRFAVSKPSFVGPWTMWAVFGILALGGGVGIALAARREP